MQSGGVGEINMEIERVSVGSKGADGRRGRERANMRGRDGGGGKLRGRGGGNEGCKGGGRN